MARQGTVAAIITAIVLASPSVAHALGAEVGGLDYKSAWECDVTKFNWYCLKEEQDQKDGAPPKRTTPKTKEEEALDRLNAWKKELEAKRALSVVEPTPENIRAYMEAQRKLLDTAALYSDIWRRLIWQNPELNYELKRPVNNAGIDTYSKERNKAELQTIANLRNEWGIFFFFKSDCPYCHRMASTLKMLSDTYGITIFPVSIDGKGLPPFFSKPQVDNGLANTLGITVVPTMILGNVKDKRMVPIGSGVVAMTDLLERIYILTSTKPGELY
jgi:conjugal transfer pilus assembly protein TraF